MYGILSNQRSHDIDVPQFDTHEIMCESNILKDMERVKAWRCWQLKPMAELLKEFSEVNDYDNFASGILREDEFALK